jgi:hypothetical protein
MRPNSPQVMLCQTPSRQPRNIGRDAHCRASSNIIEARFGHAGLLCTHPPMPGWVRLGRVRPGWVGRSAL